MIAKFIQLKLRIFLSFVNHFYLIFLKALFALRDFVLFSEAEVVKEKSSVQGITTKVVLKNVFKMQLSFDRSKRTFKVNVPLS